MCICFVLTNTFAPVLFKRHKYQNFNKMFPHVVVKNLRKITGIKYHLIYWNSIVIPFFVKRTLETHIKVENRDKQLSWQSGIYFLLLFIYCCNREIHDIYWCTWPSILSTGTMVLKAKLRPAKKTLGVSHTGKHFFIHDFRRNIFKEHFNCTPCYQNTRAK